ncbi:MAG: glycerophosphodiester phosphodiesterase family protein [Pseudomonadota bacterium]
MSLPPVFLAQSIAHRGLHTGSRTRPENSMSAFEAALMFGFGIELDVQLTRDGQAIVFHDYDLQRLLTRMGTVQSTDAAELKTGQILGANEGPPLLTEVLAVVAGQVPIFIELKDQSGTHTGTNGQLEGQVANALAGYSGPVAAMSFNPDQMMEMRRILPDIPRGVVTDPMVDDAWGMVPPDRRTFLANGSFIEEAGASFISHKASDLTAGLVARQKAKGLSVLTWTIRSEAEETVARQIADNITFEDYLPSA